MVQLLCGSLRSSLVLKSQVYVKADLRLWYTTPIERFELHASVTLAYLTSQTYGLRDVNTQLLKGSIQQMLHYARAAGMDSMFNQLTVI